MVGKALWCDFDQHSMLLMAGHSCWRSGSDYDGGRNGKRFGQARSPAATKFDGSGVRCQQIRAGSDGRLVVGGGEEDGGYE